MRIGRTILLGIFCVLFAIRAAFAQEQSDSHIIRVTKEIDVAELDEKVDNLDQSRQDLTQTLKNLDNSISNLNTNVEYLNVMVARLDERTNGNSRLLYVIIAGIFGPLLWSIYERNKKSNEGTVTSTQATQGSQNEPIPVRIVQEGESQPTPTQATEISEDEPTSTKPTQESQSDIVSDNVLQVDFSNREDPDPSLRRNSPHGKHQ